LYLWKSNLNEITGDHANENYEVNTVVYIQNLQQQKTVLYLMAHQYMKIDCLIAQEKNKSRFYKIKCTTASDQVLANPK
jgi:hypothetical protein